MKKIIAATLCGLCALPLMAEKRFQLQSPDQKVQVEVALDNNIHFSLTQGGTEVMNTTLSLTLTDGRVLGANPKVAKSKHSTADETIPSPFYKKKEVKDHYNELCLDFKGNYGLVFRAYDDGVAYRFTTRMKDSICIEKEQAAFLFTKDYKTFANFANSTAATLEGQFFNSFETTYVNEPITKINSKRLNILPLLVDLEDGKKMVITEADLEDYPGMFLNNDTEKPLLQAIHAPYPKVKEQGGHNRLQMLVKARENYIAKTAGTRAFPWRVFALSSGNDADLANGDMVYRLAAPSRVEDISWIKPGKVAWDWWNDWNISGVDFRAGINNPTYKYYIDFAAAHGIGYVILDEGWAVNLKADMLQVIPEINLQELVDYGKQKNVGIILWAGYWAFARDMEKVVKHYADMGVKGFKVDFLDRDDQDMVRFTYEAAELCARHHMILDFHGVYKPTGLQRTYPNVLNYEGVFGLEQMKWSKESVDMVTHDVTLPFIRMVAGPMDYTQGAMRNAIRGNYHPVNTEPMSQGTRCRQLATYVVFDSPFNMLCDAPTNYMREKECTRFIAKVPTVWEETRPLVGEVSKYIALARRSGEEWYMGVLTNWEARELTLDLSFLGEGNYQMELFRDGINADRAACDYKREVAPVPDTRKLTIKLAPGGGYVARFYKQ